MRTKLAEHILSIVFVTLVLAVALVAIRAGRQAVERADAARYGQLGDLAFADLDDAFQRALLLDATNAYYPGQASKNREIVNQILDHHRKQFSARLESSFLSQSLTAAKAGELFVMYLKFVLVYVVVMALTYYGVQTIAVWRFCRRRQAGAHTRTPSQVAGAALRALLLGLASFVLFCPAYVIAYSIRTELNTDTVFFMALLGVVSNGLLMVYANKFYAFLVAESRKGYVETAVVKNLHASYRRESGGGISYGDILRPVKRFTGHVFDHIFQNARHQYLSTIKEQASFLITGLIIIEMALNIHGHLSYEMLRQMLYRNDDIVIAIVLGIFYTVKATEIFTDFVVHRAAVRLENRG